MSHPFLIYVVAHRPYAEKVLNARFYFDRAKAQKEAARVNTDLGMPGLWKVWPAHLTINPENPDKV